MAVLRDSDPLDNHHARLEQYLRGIVLSSSTVAGRIIDERRPSRHARDPARPSLVLWACEALGGNVADALPVGAAFDLFDRFLVLHGELTQDGAATVERWGLGQSLNAGDALYALAFRTLAADVVNAPRRLQTARLVGQAVLEAIAGDDDTARDAVLTGAALESGAVIAGANDEIAASFRRAGRMLAADPAAATAELRRWVSSEVVDAIL
jgi:geranylgeranyl diphosphate synthase type I